jgi:hypothetical protein
MRSIIAFVLTLAFCASAYAQDNACVSPERFMSDMVAGPESQLETRVVVDIDGEPAAAAVARFNAMPPEGDMPADRIIVIAGKLKATGQDVPTVLLSFFHKGCLVKYGEAPAENVAKLLKPDHGI